MVAKMVANDGVAQAESKGRVAIELKGRNTIGLEEHLDFSWAHGGVGLSYSKSSPAAFAGHCLMTQG